ncbi:juvenile hormone esterase isoform X2 [Anabrus simplex]
MTELVTVHISEGTVRGAKARSKSGGTYYSFKGIPYAKPPLGPLRFKMAEPPEPWLGVRDALQEGSSCTQFNMYTNEFEGDEDCLYLNVYSPKLPASGSPTKLKPVMVWIHGGGYTTGSGHSAKFGPDFLVDEDVVVVTINYRLGVLGFLSVEGPAAPGNVGLKDQVVALRWVQRNIAKFGGNPDNVTVFGESAGAAAVHLHMLSPMTKGLFHRAIAESGVAFNPWGIEKHPREAAFRLGAALGNKTEDPEHLVEFLRNVDHLQLVGAAKKCPLPERYKHRLLVFPFVPCEEVEVKGTERFLPADPLKLLQEGHYHPLPYLTGFNTHEGLIMLRLADFNNPETYERMGQNMEEVIQPDIRVPENYTKMDEVVAKLRHFYLRNKPLSSETLSGFVDMQTDLQFAEGIHLTVRKMAQLAKAPLYCYLFSYDGQLNYCKINAGLMHYAGACHADEVGYLFRMEKFDWDLSPNSPDAVTRSRMVKMWTNFAKTGEPTPGADPLLPVMWPPYTVDNPCFLEIGSDLTVGKNVFQERMAFWEDLYKSI